MCGIAGVLVVHNPAEGPPPPHHDAIPDAWLDALDAGIAHRGPDGAGRFRDRATRPDGTIVDVALVHRRLSIIDHTGGAQPMVHLRNERAATPAERSSLLPPSHHIPDPLRRRPEGIALHDLTHDWQDAARPKDLVAVTFNGCIYNHRELRAELELCGHHFATDHSDTEVLIHGWREWGLRMQDELDGMYAMLIWDRNAAQLAWARDLAGEKPLSLTFDPRMTSDTRIFSSVASSMTTLQAARDFRSPRLVSTLLHEWSQHGTFEVSPYGDAVFPARFSIFPPTEAAEPDSDRPDIDRSPSATVRPLSLPTRSHSAASVAVAALDDTLLARAVTSRLEADVPLGVFLSGGLDSALIAAIAHRERPDLKAFTVRMPDPAYDESAAAAETARIIGIDHVVLDCQPTPAADLVHLIEQLGLPFGDSSLLPTYWVSRAARKHVNVALSGDGGDELFGGYRRHTVAAALNRYHRLLALIPSPLLDRRQPNSRSTYLARLGQAARHSGYDELLAIFAAPDFKRLCAINGEPPPFRPFCPTIDPLLNDFENYLPNDLLRKTDTASMAVGLEVRAPFLARELVQAALRTPLNILMPNGERKGLLKQIARRYLPDHIINRPKRGFAIPIGDWFRSDFGGMRQLLLDHLTAAEPFPGLADAGLVLNRRFINQMLREHDAAGERSLNPWHGRDHSQRLYMLLVLSIWCRWLDRLRRTHPPTPNSSEQTPPADA